MQKKSVFLTLTAMAAVVIGMVIMDFLSASKETYPLIDKLPPRQDVTVEAWPMASFKHPSTYDYHDKNSYFSTDEWISSVERYDEKTKSMNLPFDQERSDEMKKFAKKLRATFPKNIEFGSTDGTQYNFGVSWSDADNLIQIESFQKESSRSSLYGIKIPTEWQGHANFLFKTDLYEIQFSSFALKATFLPFRSYWAYVRVYAPLNNRKGSQVYFLEIRDPMNHDKNNGFYFIGPK